MTNFNFLKQAEVFIVHNNTKYTLDVSEDLKFSQTFTDSTYKQKTLQSPQNLFQESNIKKANPANFSFTIPMYQENDLKIVFDLLVDYKSSSDFTLKSFDLYIKLPESLYLIENCVITNGTFLIEKLENLKLQVSGQGTRLKHFSGNSRLHTLAAAANNTLFTRSSSVNEQLVEVLDILIDNNTIDKVYKVSVELQNNIEWLEARTIHASVDIDAASSGDTIIYPSNFVLKERILSGSVGQYVTDTSNSDVQTSKTNVPITIKAGKSTLVGFQFNMPSCSFTNRNNVEEVFTQSYDWRMNSNPTDLGTILNFNNT